MSYTSGNRQRNLFLFKESVIIRRPVSRMYFYILLSLILLGVLNSRALAKNKKLSACACEIGGKVYNLQMLAKEGGPRYQRNYAGYTFSYNPCISFTEGPGCQAKDGVAICKMSITSKSGVIVGTQTSMECSVDIQTGFKMFVYHRVDDTSFKAYVRLTCDTKRIGVDGGDFKIIEAGANPTFQLAHLCGCGNGCPLQVSTTEPSTTITRHTTHSTTPVDRSAAYIEGGVIGGVLFLLMLVGVIVFLRKRNRNRNRDRERRHLLGEVENYNALQQNGDPDAEIPPHEDPDAQIPPHEDPDAEIPPHEDPDAEIPPHEDPDAQIPPHEDPDAQIPPHEDPDAQIPPHEDPDAQIPPHEDPDAEIPPREDPDAEIPPREDPDAEILPHEDPDAKIPPHEDPDVQIPPHEAPDAQIPPHEDPDAQIPPREDPDIQIQPLRSETPHIINVNPQVPDNCLLVPVPATEPDLDDAQCNHRILENIPQLVHRNLPAQAREGEERDERD